MKTETKQDSRIFKKADLIKKAFIQYLAGVTKIVVISISQESARKNQQSFIKHFAYRAKQERPPKIQERHGSLRLLGWVPALPAQEIYFMACWDLDQKGRGLNALMLWEEDAADAFRELNRIEPEDYQP